MIIVLHAIHAGLVLVGLAAVVLLLHHSRTPRSRVDALRATGSPDGLVAEAERRALELLLGPAGPVPPPPTRWAVIVASGSVLAAAIHAFVSPEHYKEGLRFGVFFTLLTVLQLATAAAVIARPSTRLVLTVGLVNTGVVLLWGVSRTVGLPFGLAEVEPVGALDLVCSFIEVVVVACCLAWLRQRCEVGPPRPDESNARPVSVVRT